MLAVARIRLWDESGLTPLSAAAARGCTEIVRMLLACPGVDVNSRDEHGATPLFLAASSACDDESSLEAVVSMLLAIPNIDADIRVPPDNTTPLIAASKHGHSGLCTLLLSHPSVDINAQTKAGITPLISAIQSGHPTTVSTLLTHPAININLQDKSGDSALIHAAARESPVFTLLLLTSPALDLSDAPHALDRAVTYGHRETAKRLLALDDLDLSDVGKYALDSAVRHEDEELVRLLLRKGEDVDMDVNWHGGYGWTPLGSACVRGSVGVVRALIECGRVERGYRDKNGEWHALFLVCGDDDDDDGLEMGTAHINSWLDG